MNLINLARQGEPNSLSTSLFVTNTIPSSALLASTTNIANGIVVLDSLGRLPAVDGSQLTGISGGGGGISGSGTTNSVPKWNSSSSLTDSHASDSSNFTIDMGSIAEDPSTIGNINLIAAQQNATDLAGGAVNIQGGNGNGGTRNGGAVNIVGGQTSGNDSSFAGHVNITGGAGGNFNATAGDVIISSGNAVSAGLDGSIILKIGGVEKAKFNPSGKFSLTDGTQADGRILTSDAFGIASWKTLVFPFTTQTTNYTVLESDTVIFADANSGSFSITLPPFFSFPGKQYIIKKIDSSSNTVTINGATYPNEFDDPITDTIDGQTSQILFNQYDSLTVFSGSNNYDGFNPGPWYII